MYFPNSAESTVGFASSNSEQNATKISVLTGDYPSWHRKVLQELSLQVMVDLVSGNTLLLFSHCLPWLCTRNLWGHKWIAHLLQRQHWERPHSSLRCLTPGWEGDILGAQTGCTLHTKGHVGRDLHWEQNQGPAVANPGLYYLSCTSLCFQASPGLLLLCRSV